MIKAIVFELGGVLITHFPDSHAKEMERHFKIPVHDLEKIWKENLALANQGKITSQECFKRVSAQLEEKTGKKIDFKELEKYNFNLLKRPVQKIWDLIEKLKESYDLYLFSNVADFFPKLEKEIGKFHYFKKMILSYQAGYKKPEKEFYKHLIQEVGLLPEEILYIDDHAAYLEPAKQMGMNTILFKSHTQLTEDLKKIGIRWNDFKI
ncbi:MAG: HAD-IA family hydrolase [Candidatus Diapherotrites archaeon]|nr:HAD-IA family hydrolase [Candidatus Diapherotrites archaeon]